MVHYPAAIRRWVHCGHKGMNTVSINTQEGCSVNHSLSFLLLGEQNLVRSSAAVAHRL